MILKILRSKRGDDTYISTVLFVLVAVIFISFTINLFAIISAKQQLDTAADQLTRQVQLSGEVNADTDTLFNAICSRIHSVDDVQYEIASTFINGKKIQLGTPFTVKITAKAYIGGFGDFDLFPITLVSQGAGVSEEYWK